MARLTESFAKDELSMDDFEDRLQRAYAARGVAECDALVADVTEVVAAGEDASSALAVVPSELVAPAGAGALAVVAASASQAARSSPTT